MTTGVPLSNMSFCGEPTEDGDLAAEYLRVWYDANCPELHLGGWRQKLYRGLRYYILGYQDYNVDRDRHSFLIGLANEVHRIEAERQRQIAVLPPLRD